MIDIIHYSKIHLAVLHRFYGRIFLVIHWWTARGLGFPARPGNSLSPSSLIVADSNESNNKLNALVICIINYDWIRWLLIIQRNREWLATHVAANQRQKFHWFSVWARFICPLNNSKETLLALVPCRVRGLANIAKKCSKVALKGRCRLSKINFYRTDFLAGIYDNFYSSIINDWIITWYESISYNCINYFEYNFSSQKLRFFWNLNIFCINILVKMYNCPWSDNNVI